MTNHALTEALRKIVAEPIPLPGAGDTPARHRRLLAVGRQDLTLAKLAEAHWDAVAILTEAHRTPAPDALYAVWASEIPNQPLSLTPTPHGFLLNGSKMFASGAPLVHRALLTAGSQLLEIDLRTASPGTLAIDTSAWHTGAFAQTQTANLTFTNFPVPHQALLCDAGWYTSRPGFWLGALGPAACWAGGVAGLIDFATQSRRTDPHTLAHLAAMHANLWALQAFLDAAGRQIDAAPNDARAAHILALKLRHLVEQTCTDTLHRFARAYGPAPLSMDADIARRYHEADLYLRQSHAERDLESLAHLLKQDL